MQMKSHNQPNKPPKPNNNNNNNKERLFSYIQPSAGLARLSPQKLSGQQSRSSQYTVGFKTRQRRRRQETTRKTCSLCRAVTSELSVRFDQVGGIEGPQRPHLVEGRTYAMPRGWKRRRAQVVRCAV